MDRKAALLNSEPSPPEYETFLSHAGKQLEAEEIRQVQEKDAARTAAGKSIIAMSSGLPNAQGFPIIEADFRLRDGSVLHLDEEQMNIASNYGPTAGYVPLREWLLKLQKQEHQPPQLTRPNHPEGFKLAVTAGAFDGLRSFIYCLMDKEDSIILEDEVYCSVTSMVKLHGSAVPISHDDKGVLVDDLEELMSTWPQKYPDRPRPKALYAITAGNNPRGYNWTEDRMVDIYLLCRKHNLLIIEDGAYYFMQFGQQRNRSFQSLDIDGRVIRFDTFSKIVGAGYRLGWTSGPKSIIDKICYNIQYSTLHANIFSQVVLYQLLSHWGHETFLKQMGQVAEMYKKRAMIMKEAAQKHLTGLCTWTTPQGGLFFWFKVADMDITSDFINILRDRGLSVMAGHYFFHGGGKSSGIRASYSNVPEEDIEKGFKCLADVIREQKGVES